MMDYSVFESANIQRLVDAFKQLQPNRFTEVVEGLSTQQRRRIFSMSGYTPQLSDQDFASYVDLLGHCMEAMKESMRTSRRYGSDELDSTCGFHWLDTLLPEGAKRADRKSIQSIYEMSVAALECLDKAVFESGIEAVSAQRPVSAWIATVVYLGQGEIKLDVSPELIKLMNKIVVNRDENLFSTMIYTLKTRSVMETQGQGQAAGMARFAQYLDAFIPSLEQFVGSNKLKIFPASSTKVLSNLVHLHTHAMPENEHLLLPARDAMLELVTNPKGFGKSLMMRHMAANGAALDLQHVKSIKGYMDSDYVRGDGFPAPLREKIDFSVALSSINAFAKLTAPKETPGLYRQKIKGVLVGQDEEFVKRLMECASRPAAEMMKKVIHQMLPEFRNIINERGMESLLGDDLGL